MIQVSDKMWVECEGTLWSPHELHEQGLADLVTTTLYGVRTSSGILETGKRFFFRGEALPRLTPQDIDRSLGESRPEIGQWLARSLTRPPTTDWALPESAFADCLRRWDIPVNIKQLRAGTWVQGTTYLQSYTNGQSIFDIIRKSSSLVRKAFLKELFLGVSPALSKKDADLVGMLCQLSNMPKVWNGFRFCVTPSRSYVTQTYETYTTVLYQLKFKPLCINGFDCELW